MWETSVNGWTLVDYGRVARHMPRVECPWHVHPINPLRLVSTYVVSVMHKQLDVHIICVKILQRAPLLWMECWLREPPSQNENCETLQIWVDQKSDQRAHPPPPENVNCQGACMWRLNSVTCHYKESVAKMVTQMNNHTSIDSEISGYRRWHPSYPPGTMLRIQYNIKISHRPSLFNQKLKDRSIRFVRRTYKLFQRLYAAPQYRIVSFLTKL